MPVRKKATAKHNKHKPAHMIKGSIAALVYHVKTQSFWNLSFGANACCYRILQNQSFLYTSDINGNIFLQDNGTSFNGVGITWNTQIPWQDMGAISVRKKGDLAYTLINNANSNIIYADTYINQQSISTITGSVLQSNQVNGQNLMEASCIIPVLFKSISINFRGTLNTTIQAPSNVSGGVFDTAVFDTSVFATGGSNIPLGEPLLTIYKVAISTRALEFSRLTD